MHECVECGFNFWNAINFFIPGIGRLGSEWKFVWFFLGGTISWTGKRTFLSFLDGPPLRALTGHFIFRVRWLDILFQSLRAFRRAGAYEKRFSIKMTLFACKFKNLLSSRTRRGIKKRPLSESAFDTFFVFSRHLMQNVFLSKWHLSSRRFKNLLWSRTWREEIKRPLSESAFDTFFMFSRHLMNQVRHIPNRYAKNLPMTKLISRWLN